MSRRLCFSLDLVDDAALIEEYRRLHEPGAVWPGVIDHIRALGIEAMEIWQRGERLFMIIEAADDFPRPVDTPSLVEINLRWERAMDRFQQRLKDAAPGEKWSPLERIFLLAAQTGARELI
jgi:L-rhamnose mutarotase